MVIVLLRYGLLPDRQRTASDGAICNGRRSQTKNKLAEKIRGNYGSKGNEEIGGKLFRHVGFA